ncbi:ATP-binding cassette domain-containing protein [Weissella coleopterorum]|uniref:ATP-binding cassette domain-containing protein n=1 Tax=Weissella coleopterorum TaxID=2714949 RepID=A0A6G8B0P0_9LACO|nr:ATP-binding cassette domain-containing protein [Weissella coleopterorum]QIL50807.1 ATP-binding cassette domain-containing protein [Weissella coleopterorum]
MDNKITVSANHVTKKFDLAERQSDKVKVIFKFWGRGIPNFWAVKGVSFTAHAGETIGIIGTNGSGKSTLLEMVAGLSQPTSGEMTINGSTSIIAIGAGMRPQLTGRANIKLKALMQGMSEKEIDRKMDSIIEFSELGDFIDQPVKNYSSGMKSKLGFAISVYSDADIIIIDEALSVGDPTFTEKSLERTRRFKKEGKTIFFVTHSSAQMRKMADRVIWMHYGSVRMDGPIDEVLPKYDHFLKRFNQFSEPERLAYQKHYKNAQKDFNLNRLRQLEYNRHILDGDDMNAVTDKRAWTHSFTEDDEKMGIISKIFLIVISILTLITIDKNILNMSWTGVLNNPRHLITNLTPSKLSALEKRHSNKSTNDIVYNQNKYKVPENTSLYDVSSEFNVPIDKLMQVNHKSTTVLNPGDILIIPIEGEK